MQTPEEQNIRRSTRSALTEIPTRLGMLTLTDREGRRSLNNNFQNRISESINIIDGNVPTSLLSPSPSPDEMIIRQRGRRRIPITFSPDIDELKRNRLNTPKDRTPVKQPSSPGSATNSGIVLRSTPRKRLLLTDGNEGHTFSEQFHLSPSKGSPKKLKLEPSSDSSFDEMADSLKACTSNQLISVIAKLLARRPELETDLKDIIPIPDLRPLENHLTYLKRNVSKALPVSRLCSKTDAIAYHRAATHLANFKKTIMDHGRRFAESKQWGIVIDYVLMAWKLVRMIPVFDNPNHNLYRRQCFKFLAAQCALSFKHGNFTREQLSHYQSRIKNFSSDSDEIKLALSQLNNKMNC